MVGFKKYERLLNKTNKEKAFVQLVESNDPSKQTELLLTNGCGEENIPNGNFCDLIQQRIDIKNKIREIKNDRTPKPKLYLGPCGERALLSSKDEYKFPLSFSSIQDLLVKAITGYTTLRWCQLLRHKQLSRVVVVMVEGLGVSEVATIEDWREGEMEDEDTEVGTPPPCKRRKTSPEEGGGKTSPEEGRGMTPEDGTKEDETSTDLPEGEGRKEEGERIPPGMERAPRHCPVLLRALPQSSPLFGFHLETHAPSQHSGEPVDELLNVSLSKSFTRKVAEECEDMDEANEKNLVTKTFMATQPQMHQERQAPSPKEGKKKKKPHRDKMDRRELLLSLRELLKHSFPVRVKGALAFYDPEFQPLHSDVSPVTPSSPLFAVDCEMCLTRCRSELARVSVMDENLRLVYSSYVKPRAPIINYLTRYSGITREHLSGVNTTLTDVQDHLRKILPKDAILVGHSLNCDMEVLKLIHPYMIDTSVIFNLRGQRHLKPGLKLLTKLFFGRDIQTSKTYGHDPSEDAGASLELALLKLRHDKTFGDAVKGGDFPFREDERRHTEQLVREQKAQSLLAPPLHTTDFRRNVFMLPVPKYVTRDYSIITQYSCLPQFRHYETTNQPYLGLRAKRDLSAVLVEAARATNKVVICHCKMRDSFLEEDKTEAKAELRELDSKLQSLYEVQPEHTLVLTVLTGSPCSVPLNKRSNGVVMVGLTGQRGHTPPTSQRWKCASAQEES